MCRMPKKEQKDEASASSFFLGNGMETSQNRHIFLTASRLFDILYEHQIGEMSEWFMELVLKTSDAVGTGGSNPSLSANQLGVFPP
jgi:hypothetical protein